MQTNRPALLLLSALCPKKDGRPAAFQAAGKKAASSASALPATKTHGRVRGSELPVQPPSRKLTKRTKCFGRISAHAAEEFKHFHLMLSITLFIPQFQPLKY